MMLLEKIQKGNQEYCKVITEDGTKLVKYEVYVDWLFKKFNEKYYSA